jgi:CubicO group peptidase (beta-lactamase class C family)
MKRLLVPILLFLVHVSQAQTWQDTLAKIEKAFERYKPAIPGAQVTISRNGKILFSRAYGMADLEHGAALTTQSPTEAGSVSKQFTAAAILLLEQEGKLSLNDDVRKYIPELPDYGKIVTLRHMMQHTSGLKDWGAVAAMTGWPRSTKTYNNDDALYIASKQRSLNHEPGVEYIYSNSNYNLFAVIVQRVSGQSLAEYSRVKIFQPAGMNNTQWRDDFRRVVPGRAIAYMKSGNNYLMNMPTEYVYGNGGLLTTTEDLVKWVDYYQSGKFGNPSLLQRQITSTPFNNGRKHNYAAGLFIDTHNGKKLIKHDGATASYRANLDYLPELNLTIAWLSNSSEFDNDGGVLISTLRGLFVPAQESTSPQAIFEKLPVEKLQTYVGWYQNHRSHTGVKVYVRDGDLWADPVGKINPLTESRFVIGGGPNTFNFTNEKGRELIVIQSGGDSVFFRRRDSAIVNDKTLSEYAGVFYSDNAEAKVKIELKSGKLVLSQMSGKSTIMLTPAYKDGFGAFGGFIFFERDNKDKVTGFLYSVGRARNMKFERVSNQ